MSEVLKFKNRDEFRSWLSDHAQSKEGVWLLFGKGNGPKTILANEALEEALCYGWIDGLMKRIDDTSYKKYFAQRRTNSKWSDKNKAIVAKLEKEGRLTELGKDKITEAKNNGQWDAINPLNMTEEHITIIAELLKDADPAYRNYMAMSASVQKTYARAYYDAKTETGRTKRLAWMIDRLNKNLKPM